MKDITKTMITEKDLLKSNAELLNTHNDHKIYEIYPVCYIVENEKIIHSYASLHKRGETQ
jgi:hypothetical protein